MAIFLFALCLALIFTLVFSYGVDKKREFSDLFLFFLLLLLPIWTFTLWIPPFGPMFGGVAFLVPLFIGLIILGIIAAATPKRYFMRSVTYDTDELKKNDPLINNELSGPANYFIWALFIFLIAAIIVGHTEGHYLATK